MKALAATLLALLLCGPPGRGQVQDQEEDDVDPGQEGYDEEEDDDEEDYETDAQGDGAGDGLLCYVCQSLPGPESCQLRRRCGPRHHFCKTFVSHGDTEAGTLTIYSAWCSDTCHPIRKTVERTLISVTCCQSPLCNVPPWQGPGPGQWDPQDSGTGDAPGGGTAGRGGCPLTMTTTLLLSLLCGLHFLGP